MTPVQKSVFGVAATTCEPGGAARRDVATLTSLVLQQEAVDGAGGAGHVGERDLPQVPGNTKT